MSGPPPARSEHVLGDSGPHARYPGELWPALADPASAPAHPVPRDGDPLERHVEHWAPLVALTLGALGWGRPDVGVTRWMADGMPPDGGALDLVGRWYGRRAAGLVAWSRASAALAEYSSYLSDELRLPMPAARVPLAASTEVFPALTAGGPDPLRLGRVVRHLVAPADSTGPGLAGRGGHAGHASQGATVFLGPEGTGTAVLLLEHYLGWYRVLHERCAGLPALPGRASWRVDVVVRSIGSLGLYRRSALTGRWFTGTEAVHLLGWPSLS